MTTASVHLLDIYEGLKHKFLFKNDFNSIYLLLALYDLEENISNVYPKYITTKKIRDRLNYVLRNRRNALLLAHNISLLVHEDVNRLELCFYLEGYKYGYLDNQWGNRLEEATLDLYGIKWIHNNKFLFHFDYPKDIKDLKEAFEKEIDNREKRERNIKALVLGFCDKVINKKLTHLDYYIDSQLKMNFDIHNFYIEDEKYLLTKDEIGEIYHSIVRILIKNLKIIYKDVAWYGLNDKVLKRYKT